MKLAKLTFLLAIPCLLLPLSVLPTRALQAQSGTMSEADGASWVDAVDVIFGGYAHYSDRDDYEGPPLFGGVEASHDDTHLVGVSLFNNSYGQFSQFFYYGYKWPLPFISDEVHFRLAGGVLHGYKGEFEDEVPFNRNGWSPAIIPSFGWRRDRIGVDVTALGVAGVLFTVNYRIWKR